MPQYGWLMRSKKFNLTFSLFCAVTTLFLTAQLSLGEDWQELRSRHAIVYYTRNTESFARIVSKAVEEDYYYISSALGIPFKDRWTVNDRVHIYIHESQQEYIVASQQGEWSSGVAIGKEKSIRTYPQAAGFFDTLLPHELTHLIFYKYVGDRADVPRWFNEGIAMYQEKARRYGSHRDVKQAIADKRFWPLGQLSNIRLAPNSSNEDVELFYAESASAVAFMVHEMGEQRFQLFCRALRDGGSFEKVLTTTYRRFRSIDDMNKAWVDYIKRQ